MGKTTVLVDEALIKSALKITHMKNKKEVIEAGLQELIFSAGGRDICRRLKLSMMVTT